MGKPLRILMVEDSEDDVLLVLRELQRGGYDVEFERVETAEAMKSALTHKTWDLILSDFTMPDFNAPQALEVLKASGLDLPFIILSGTIGEETAVAALKAGAHDFLVKGQFARLGPAIERELREAETRRERSQAEAQLKYHARLLRHVNDAVIATDDQLRITAWNRAAERMYGWSGEEVMGHNISEILSDRLTDAQREEARELLKESIALPGERIYHHKDGRTVYVEANTIALLDAHGKMTGYVSVDRDITERKRAEMLIQRQLQRLKALHAIDMAISSSFDIQVILDVLLQQVLAQLEVDAAAVLLLNPARRTLEYAASRGFHSGPIHNAKVKLGEDYADRAVVESRLIHIPNIGEAGGRLAEAQTAAGENLVDYYCAPLIVKGQVKGVLEIYHSTTLQPDRDWLDFMETLAGQAAIAIDNTQLFDSLQRSNLDLRLAYDDTIEGWSRALDLRDKETEGHTLRVTQMTLDLARQYNFAQEELQNIRWGALLHDIGKMGIPDNILLKPDKLTEEEWVIMKKHPVFALEMLSPIAHLKSALDIPYCHHEKQDGTGYPRGLKGGEIPLVARLFAVVDVWDAITSDRPYRAAWTKERALDYIKEQSGKYFDPKVVEAFIRLIADER